MQHKTALVVDSNPNSRELIRILLEHEGYRTVETGDSVEAVELASATSPDLVLIDLQMPRLEGYATAKKLRQSGRFKKLIVALTGRELDSDPAQISAAGFTATISKPVVLRGLHERLSQIHA
jgi:CheY-like chemotaxis protein